MTSKAPPEIVYKILEEVNDIESLRRCRLACHAFAEIGASIAFRVVSVDFTADFATIAPVSKYVKKAVIRLDSWTAHASTLGQAGEEFLRFLQRLRINGALTRYKRSEEGTVEERLDVAICSLKHLLKMPKLSNIGFWFPSITDVHESGVGDGFIHHPGFKYLILRQLQEQIFHFLAKAHLKQGVKIDTLELRDLLAYALPEDIYSKGLSTFLGSLRTLSLDVQGEGVGYEGDWGEDDDVHGFTRDIAKTIIKGSCNIETLIYAGEVNTYESENRWAKWRSIFLPKLKSLWLKRIYFDVAKEAAIATSFPVNFILSHRATLQELHMVSCVTDWDHSTRWNKIFDLFRQQMDALTRVSFEPLPGKNPGYTDFCGYYTLDDFGEELAPYSKYGHRHKDDTVIEDCKYCKRERRLKGRDARDKKAFQSLQNTVSIRE